MILLIINLVVVVVLAACLLATGSRRFWLALMVVMATFSAISLFGIAFGPTVLKVLGTLQLPIAWWMFHDIRKLEADARRKAEADRLRDLQTKSANV